MEKRHSAPGAWVLAAALTAVAWGCSPEPPPAPAVEKPAAVRPITAPPELLETQEAFVAVSRQVIPAVVNIRAARRGKIDTLIPLFEDFFHDLFKNRPRPKREEKNLGSGFIISADGHILTNAHVVKGAEEIRVKLADQRVFAGKLVGLDSRTDVAVLKIENAGKLPGAVTLGDSDKLRVGEWALAVGNPFGLEGTMTVGIISATRRTDMGIEEYEDFIQTDASINPGNSGGPLVNIFGEVIGVNTAIVAAGQGIGFAIPINLAHSIAEQLIGTGEVTRGWLGVMIQNLTPELAISFGLQEPRGVLVNGVIADSPAEKGGIQRGDVILAVKGRKVEGVGDFKLLIAHIPPGETADLKLWRNGAFTTVTLTLDSSPPVNEVPESAAGNHSTRIGITVDPAEAAEGLSIVKVDPQSPAAAHGVRVGDRLLSVNRRDTNNLEDFQAAVKDAESSGQLLLLLRRGDNTLYMAFPLSKK